MHLHLYLPRWPAHRLPAFAGQKEPECSFEGLSKRSVVFPGILSSQRFRRPSGPGETVSCRSSQQKYRDKVPIFQRRRAAGKSLLRPHLGRRNPYDLHSDEEGRKTVSNSRHPAGDRPDPSIGPAEEADLRGPPIDPSPRRWNRSISGTAETPKSSLGRAGLLPALCTPSGNQISKRARSGFPTPLAEICWLTPHDIDGYRVFFR